MRWVVVRMNKLWLKYNFKCIFSLTGKNPQRQGNIATPKLIQWKTAEARGNKPFRRFGSFIFSVFELFSVSEAVSPSKFAPPFNDSGQSLKGLNRAGAESCAGSDSLGIQRCLLSRQIRTWKAHKARKRALSWYWGQNIVFSMFDTLQEPWKFNISQ